MPDNIIYQYPYLFVALTALIVNIPLGYIRENCPKFSFQWLFWIHASIPLIIYMRINLDVSKLFIPLFIFFAVVGQILGSRWRRKYMSVMDQESLVRIPPIETGGQADIPDSEVMVALLNMGGPRTNADVKDFQRRLFSDPLLIRFPMSFLFQKLFATLLIAFRLKATEKRYQLIGGGSTIFD